MWPVFVKIAAGYFLIVNLLGACVTAADKRAAKRGKWRVRESTLFFLSVIGGCPGVYLTMRLIGHKTLHKRFMWGLPAIFLIQAALLACLYLWGKGIV